jgi:hypothetical protein
MKSQSAMLWAIGTAVVGASILILRRRRKNRISNTDTRAQSEEPRAVAEKDVKFYCHDFEWEELANEIQPQVDHARPFDVTHVNDQDAWEASFFRTFSRLRSLNLHAFFCSMFDCVQWQKIRGGGGLFSIRGIFIHHTMNGWAPLTQPIFCQIFFLLFFATSGFFSPVRESIFQGSTLSPSIA